MCYTYSVLVISSSLGVLFVRRHILLLLTCSPLSSFLVLRGALLSQLFSLQESDPYSYPIPCYLFHTTILTHFQNMCYIKEKRGTVMTEQRPRNKRMPSHTVSFNINSAHHMTYHSLAIAMDMSDSELIRRAIQSYVKLHKDYYKVVPDYSFIKPVTIYNEYALTDAEFEELNQRTLWELSRAGRKAASDKEKLRLKTIRSERAKKARAARKPKPKTEIMDNVQEVLVPTEVIAPVKEPKPELPIIPMTAAVAKYPEEAVLKKTFYCGKWVMMWSLKPVIFNSPRWRTRLYPLPTPTTDRMRKMVALLEGIETFPKAKLLALESEVHKILLTKGLPIDVPFSVLVCDNILEYSNFLYPNDTV